MRLICVTMESQLKPDKYRDVKALLDYAFSTWTGYTPLAEGAASAQLTAAGGGGPLGEVTVLSPGVQLLLAPGLTAQDVTVELELPARYLLGAPPEVTAVYTVQGGAAQQTASIRLPARSRGWRSCWRRMLAPSCWPTRTCCPGVPLGRAGDRTAGSSRRSRFVAAGQSPASGPGPPAALTAGCSNAFGIQTYKDIEIREEGIYHGQIYVYADRDPRRGDH